MYCRQARCTALFMVLALALYPLLSGVPVSGQSSRAETFVEGDIAAGTVWSVSGSPYHLNDSVTVLDGVNLQIQSGVTVKFGDWATLTIKGTLIASGVQFTSAANSPSSGDWDGIVFDGAKENGTVLDSIRITYASTALTVKNSQVRVTNSVFTRFDYYGIEVSDGGSVNITGSTIESNDGDGIDCLGNLQAGHDTIIGKTAIYSETECTGFVDNSVITANPTYGIEASSDSSLVISNDVINSTYPDSSYGIYAYMGARIVLKGDDIAGHLYCIYTESGAIRIDSITIRNYYLYGIYTDVPLTVKGSFVGKPKPTASDKSPSDGNSKISFDGPLNAPIDIPGLEQPPSAAITNYVSASLVKGKVTLEGAAWDPDAGDTITKVEVRIMNDEGSELVPWTKADGTSHWKYNWDTSKQVSGTYSVHVKATSSKGEVSDPSSIYLAVDTNANGNITNPFNSIMMMYTYMCIAVVIIIIVVVVVIVYIFVSRRKRAQPQQVYQQPVQMLQPPQPMYQPQPQPYQQAYVQPYPAQYPYQQPAPRPAPVAPKETPYILEDVFLIYRDGRLIHHDTRRLKPEVDDQMLGGMFTAIQEFIGQSFPSEDGSKGIIKEIQYEDSKIILEHGQYVYLAVVSRDIKDTAALHNRMSRLIKAIEIRCAEPLMDWDGSTESVTEAKRMVKMMYSDESIDLLA